MANMAHCRFQNTLEDLKDCQEHLSDDWNENDQTKMSDEEIEARDQLVNVCKRIVEDFINR